MHIDDIHLIDVLRDPAGSLRSGKQMRERAVRFASLLECGNLDAAGELWTKVEREPEWYPGHVRKSRNSRYSIGWDHKRKVNAMVIAALAVLDREGQKASLALADANCFLAERLPAEHKDQIEPLILRAVAIWKSQLEQPGAEMAERLERAAVCLNKHAMNAKAIEYQLEAVAQREAAEGDNALETAYALNTLATLKLRSKLEKNAECRALWQRAFDIEVRNKQSSGEAIRCLPALRWQLEFDLEEMDRFSREQLSKWEAKYGKSDLTVAHALELRKAYFDKTGASTEALTAAERIVQIGASKLKSGAAPLVQQARLSLVVQLRKQQQYARAEQVARRILQFAEQADRQPPGKSEKSDLNLAAVKAHIFESCLKQGKEENFSAWKEELLQWYDTCLSGAHGALDPGTAPEIETYIRILRRA